MTEEKFIKLKKVVMNDVKITEDNLLEKAKKIPFIYHRYLDLFIAETKKLKSLKIETEKLYAKKYHKFKFEHDFALNNKGEIDVYINGDDEYYEMKRKYNWQIIVVKYLEETLENINRMSFAVNNTIKLKEFYSGN